MPSRKEHDSPPPDAKIKLGDVAHYLGVGWRVAQRLVREGKIKPVLDPLDNRRKLVCISDLDRLKQESSKTGK